MKNSLELFKEQTQELLERAYHEKNIKTSYVFQRPGNPVTESQYTGINALTIILKQAVGRVNDHLFMTKKQAEKEGMVIRDTAHKVPLFFYDNSPKTVRYFKAQLLEAGVDVFKDKPGQIEDKIKAFNKDKPKEEQMQPIPYKVYEKMQEQEKKNVLFYRAETGILKNYFVTGLKDVDGAKQTPEAKLWSAELLDENPNLFHELEKIASAKLSEKLIASESSTILGLSSSVNKVLVENTYHDDFKEEAARVKGNYYKDDDTQKLRDAKITMADELTAMFICIDLNLPYNLKDLSAAVRDVVDLDLKDRTPFVVWSASATAERTAKMILGDMKEDLKKDIAMKADELTKGHVIDELSNSYYEEEPDYDLNEENKNQIKR